MYRNITTQASSCTRPLLSYYGLVDRRNLRTERFEKVLPDPWLVRPVSTNLPRLLARATAESSYAGGGCFRHGRDGSHAEYAFSVSFAIPASTVADCRETNPGYFNVKRL